MKKKSPVGIVDPFNEPKKKVDIPSPYDDPYGTADEERFLRAPPSLDLDGDSYVVRFTGGVTPETATEALVKLLYEVNANNRPHLVTHGVWVGTEEDDSLVLKSPFGTVSVYRDAGGEIAAFRRIGMALWHLPDKRVLKKHQVKIIKRG